MPTHIRNRWNWKSKAHPAGDHGFIFSVPLTPAEAQKVIRAYWNEGAATRLPSGFELITPPGPAIYTSDTKGHKTITFTRSDGSIHDVGVLPITIDPPAKAARDRLREQMNTPTCPPRTRLSDLVDGTPDEINATVEHLNRTDEAVNAANHTDFTDREVATILHGLRMIQCQGRIEGCNAGDCDHFDEAESLNNEQIDDLCERINLGPIQPAPAVQDSDAADSTQDGVEVSCADYKALTDAKRHLSAVLECLGQLSELLKDSHDGELQNNHGGDGAAGCSYCDAIVEADRTARIALSLPERDEQHCYNCNTERPIVADDGERCCLLCGSGIDKAAS